VADTWTIRRSTRGTPLLAFGLCKILWTLPESNPKPPLRYGLAGPGLPPDLLVLLNMYMEIILFMFDAKFKWRRKGLGLSPSPWFQPGLRPFLHITTTTGFRCMWIGPGPWFSGGPIQPGVFTNKSGKWLSG
jgi:hypothetical protein